MRLSKYDIPTVNDTVMFIMDNHFKIGKIEMFVTSTELAIVRTTDGEHTHYQYQAYSN